LELQANRLGIFGRSLSITKAEIFLGGELAGLFGDAPRVLAMALVWGFVAEDQVCRNLGLPQWSCDRQS